MLDRDCNKFPLQDCDILNETGVYVFHNIDGVPIRIGKAKKLRNRVLSYFTRFTDRDQQMAMEMTRSFATHVGGLSICPNQSTLI